MDEVDFQAAYVRDLLGETDYPTLDVEGVAEIFKQWLRGKQKDILGYRNLRYRSTITGTLSPAHHTPWMQAMDDSLEALLSDRPEVPRSKASWRPTLTRRARLMPCISRPPDIR